MAVIDGDRENQNLLRKAKIQPAAVTLALSKVLEPAARLWTLSGNASGLVASSSSVAPASSTTESFTGDIALLRVYNDSLSATEVTSIYSATTAIPEPSSFAIVALGGLLMLPRRRWAV